MSANPLPGDQRFCRAMLPRVSRTFAINIRLLGGSLGEAVRTGYLLCRAADTLEDGWLGSPAEVGARFDGFEVALGGDAAAARELARRAAAERSERADFALLASLPRVLAVFESLPGPDREIVRAGVGTLAAGMRRYATRAAGRPAGAAYLDTEAELHDYCWVVAGCVGVMLTRLFERRLPAAHAADGKRRLEAAPAVGEALQLTNILLDWPADLRRGRCHLPAAWLAEWDLTPADLVAGDSPGVRVLASRLESLARAALARVPDYLDLIPARCVRYRLFCLWPALWAAASLRYARQDAEFPWGARRPRLPRSELWRSALASVLGAHSPGGVRKLCATAGAPGGPAAPTAA